MVNEAVARRYAVAIFDLARERGEADAVGRDLHLLLDTIFGDPGTKEFFLAPIVDRKEKQRALLASFTGKVHEIALHGVVLLVSKRREALLPEIARQYDALQLQARGAEPLAITSARRLPAAELRDVVRRLEELYGKKFEVQEHVDPNVIGGVRIMMGDRRIDGSVQGRLEELSRTLFAQT